MSLIKLDYKCSKHITKLYNGDIKLCKCNQLEKLLVQEVKTEIH